jgi:hypothetical protein
MSKVFSIAIISKWFDEDSIEYRRSKALRTKLRTSLSKVISNSDTQFQVEVRNVRASAGQNVFHSIYNRIKNSDIIVVDLSTKTEDLRNIWLELGIALAIAQIKGKENIYLITADDISDNLIHEVLPSDLQGFFLTSYNYREEGKIKYGDNNSFLMSLHVALREWLRVQKNIETSIDEDSIKDQINEDEK